jgi:MFS family permease
MTRKWLANAPRGQFWLFFTASLFFSFGFSVFFFLFNLYLLGFGFTERSLGLIGSLMAMGGIVGTIPAGICAERFGLRVTLIGGLGLTVFFSLLRICILGEPAQLALAGLAGITLCSWAVCLSPAVAGLTMEHERPFAFGLMFSSGIGVGALGALVAGRLPGLLPRLAAMEAKRATLELACGVAALAIVPLSRLSVRSTVARVRPSWAINPFLLRFLPAMAIWALVTGAFPPFANVYFVHHLGVSLQTMGSVFSLSQLVQFLAVLGAPVLFRLTGLVKGIFITQIATGAALAGLAMIQVGTHAAWMYAVYMALQCMNEPGIYSLLMDRVPLQERNRASAFTFFVSSGSQAIASAVVGAAIVRLGYSSVLFGIAGLAVVAAILFAGLNPRADLQAIRHTSGLSGNRNQSA